MAYDPTDREGDAIAIPADAGNMETPTRVFYEDGIWTLFNGSVVNVNELLARADAEQRGDE